MADKKTDPRINRSTYSCYPSTGTGTINTGTTLNCWMGNIEMAVSVLVTNFNTSGNLIARLNYSTNDAIVVAAGKTLTLNDEKITRVFLTNNSGSAITYQVVFVGG